MVSGVLAGGDPIEDALEAESQAERLQADRVWIQEPRSSGAHELSGAEWLQLRDVPELAGARMLRWTDILKDRELHIVANASENESSAAVYQEERGSMDKSSL